MVSMTGGSFLYGIGMNIAAGNDGLPDRFPRSGKETNPLRP